jgi:2-dehydropantoate 2-reductase
MVDIISGNEDLRAMSKAFTDPRIAVAGAGAIGSVIGGSLTRAGADVWFVDPWLDHVRALQAHGLFLQDPDTTSSIRVKALHISEADALRDIDILLVCVKSYDTASTVSLLKPCLRPGAFAVSCQNGINEDTIASILGASFTLGCVIHLGAMLMGPGHAKRLRRGGHFVVGELDGKVTERVKSLALLLSSCAETIITDNLRGHRWVKLAYNSSGNPLLALTGYTVQELYAQEKAIPLIRAIILELIRVAEACGHRLEPIHGIPAEIWKTNVFTRVDAIEVAFREHARVLGNRRSSMVYDLEQGRPMETDFLNGYVARKGEDVGVATPVNRAIAEMLYNLEQGRVRPHPTTLVPLLALVEQSYRK